MQMDQNITYYIFEFAVSPELMKILPIEKCIIIFETPCVICYLPYIYMHVLVNLMYKSNSILSQIV